jgi:hypothetical protein
MAPRRRAREKPNEEEQKAWYRYLVEVWGRRTDEERKGYETGARQMGVVNRVGVAGRLTGFQLWVMQSGNRVLRLGDFFPGTAKWRRSQPPASVTLTWTTASYLVDVVTMPYPGEAIQSSVCMSVSRSFQTWGRGYFRSFKLTRYAWTADFGPLNEKMPVTQVVGELGVGERFAVEIVLQAGFYLPSIPTRYYGIVA